MINKIVASGLACGMILFSAGANAASDSTSDSTSRDDGIIFRIEDIKPVKDEQGLISQCEFFVTVYNRTDKAVKEADLNLSWKDNISGKYKLGSKEVEVENDEAKINQILTKSVKLKDISPRQQKSFKQVINTDKCYLLFDNVDYNVPVCIAEGDEIKIKNNRRMGNGSCTGVFDYVNTQNPEYYSEFKDVPESDLEKAAEEQKKKDAEALENLHKESLETIDEVSKILSAIK